MSSYKLIGLSISNIRKLRAVELQFAPSGVTELRGQNQQGKTTVLKSIEMLIAGKGAIPADVVTHGEESGKIIGKLTNSETGQTFTVEKIIKDGDQKLKVTTGDGLQVNKPQTFLDTLITEATINPRPFMLKKASDKTKHLMDFLHIDFKEVDKEIANLETERTVVGREKAKLGKPEPVEIVMPVDTTKLNAEKTEINEKMTPAVTAAFQKYNTEKVVYDAAIKKKTDTGTEIADQMAEIVRLQTLIAEAQEKITTLSADLFTIVIPDEPVAPNAETMFVAEKARIAEIDKQIADAAITNEKAKTYKEYQEKINAIGAKAKEYDDYTAKIKTLRANKMKKLGETKMPIPGLSIVIDQENKEDGVYFNDIHSDNWSESEALRISLAIAAAAMPGLRAIFLDGANSFDKKNLAAIHEWSLQHDIQVIITIVDDRHDFIDEPNIFYIEEGKLL